MPPERSRESRRSTRVPIKVLISAHGVSELFICEGETIVVNRHGALLSCFATLRLHMRIEIHVILTDKRSLARVVYVDPERPLRYGIELEKPQNIWGISLPPDDWQEDSRDSE